MAGARAAAPPAFVRLPPAEEQPRRHDVPRLELLVDPGERLLQEGQHRPGELVDQERPVGVKHVVRGPQDAVAHVGRHGAVRDPRDDVVGMPQPAGGEIAPGFRRGAFHDLQSPVADRRRR